MTFEQIDNAPTKGKISETEMYTFFNKRSQTIPNTPTRFENKFIPTQVIREKEIRSELQKINSEYRLKAPGVWKNYQLVEVMWPESPLADKHNNKFPLSDGGATPKLAANTTMETFVQQTKNCMSCHTNASLKINVNGTDKTISTDYSFIIPLLYKYSSVKK